MVNSVVWFVSFSTTPRTPPLRASRGARAKGFTAKQEQALTKKAITKKHEEELGADFLGGSLTEEDFMKNYQIADSNIPRVDEADTFVVKKVQDALEISKEDAFSNSKESMFQDAEDNTDIDTIPGARDEKIKLNYVAVTSVHRYVTRCN